MSEPNDWRLTGQDAYLRGATLEWRRYRRPRPSWDHAHCAFCWSKFTDQTAAEPGGSEARLSDALREGFTTTEEHPRGAEAYWICEPCFVDFRERFDWDVRSRDGVGPDADA